MAYILDKSYKYNTILGRYFNTWCIMTKNNIWNYLKVKWTDNKSEDILLIKKMSVDYIKKIIPKYKLKLLSISELQQKAVSKKTKLGQDITENKNYGKPIDGSINLP